MLGSQNSKLPASAFAARLFSISAVFALAVLLEMRGGGAFSARVLSALYALVLVGFTFTLGYGLLFEAGRTRWLGLVEIVGDGGLIWGLIYCTGGTVSPFAFLFLIWIVHAAIRLGSFGAIPSAFAAIAMYGALVWGEVGGWLAPFEGRVSLGVQEAVQVASTYSLSCLAVAILAHQLARQVRIGHVRLEELSEIHRKIIDNVSSGLLTVDRQGVLTSFNREAEHITGYKAKHVLGRKLDHVFPQLAEAELDPASTVDEAEARGRVDFRSEDGSELALGFSVSNLGEEPAAPEGRIVIFQDLTRLLRLEEELRLSERMSAVGQLAAGLAHEIRNPLASLSGAIELLAPELTPKDPSSRRLFEIVQRETQRLSRLVGDFLSYARPGPAQRERVDLGGLAEELRELLAMGEYADLVLECEVARELSVLGNPDQLRQVIWNLVLNAAQAEPVDGIVRVVANVDPEMKQPMVEIRVEDHGSGIPDELRERVLEPFYTTKSKGTGLGLATVHSIVAAHGGRLRIESEVGKGTTIYVYWPRDVA